jgi:hypothetical protein
VREKLSNAHLVRISVENSGAATLAAHAGGGRQGQEQGLGAERQASADSGGANIHVDFSAAVRTGVGPLYPRTEARAVEVSLAFLGAARVSEVQGLITNPTPDHIVG